MISDAYRNLIIKIALDRSIENEIREKYPISFYKPDKMHFRKWFEKLSPEEKQNLAAYEKELSEKRLESLDPNLVKQFENYDKLEDKKPIERIKWLTKPEQDIVFEDKINDDDNDDINFYR